MAAPRSPATLQHTCRQQQRHKAQHGSHTHHPARDTVLLHPSLPSTQHMSVASRAATGPVSQRGGMRACDAGLLKLQPGPSGCGARPADQPIGRLDRLNSDRASEREQKLDGMVPAALVRSSRGGRRADRDGLTCTGAVCERYHIRATTVQVEHARYRCFK